MRDAPGHAMEDFVLLSGTRVREMTVRLADPKDAQRSHWKRVLTTELLAATVLVAARTPFFASVFAPLAES